MDSSYDTTIIGLDLAKRIFCTVLLVATTKWQAKTRPTLDQLRRKLKLQSAADLGQRGFTIAPQPVSLFA